jgi:hypothetical protein
MEHALLLSPYTLRVSFKQKRRMRMPLQRRCRVLIVEDEYFLADELEKAFNARGVEVIGPAI